MPKGNRGGQGYQTAAQSVPNYNTQTTQVGSFGRAYSPMTNGQLNQAYQQSRFAINNADINVKYAVLQYIRQDIDASGHSPSQNLNHKLETGGTLTQNEERMMRNLDKGMTPLGQDTVLYRADHATGIMNKLGITGWEKMTQSQLTAAVVGKTFTENKFLSTSTSTQGNPFITGAQSGGRSAMLTIKTPAKTQAIIGNPKQNEAVLARGQQVKILSARFTGQTAYPRGGGAYPVIAFDVELL